MSDFLLELLSEEIPARMQAKARNDLARMFAEGAREAGLATGAIDTHSTPRRLVLIASGVAARTEAVREELKGPRASAPPQALEGFLRKTGLTREQLEERDGVLFAVIERPGRPAADVIGELVERILRDFPWPKSMRWGEGSERWVRPLQGIVAMLDEAIVPVRFAGIESGATTVGHRFHHPGPITLGGAVDYAEKLRACHVIVDQDERERIVREGAESAAADAGLALIADEGLVVENAGLTEWPVPLLGRFDAEFLDVPREVIVLTMRTNQKYFACNGDDGGLAPAFVCVANIEAGDGGAAIVEGNKRVLAARLNDARFFWEQDLKAPLEANLPRLDGILFYEGMGSLRAKAERVANLAAKLTEAYFPERDPETARRAGLLAKADLASGMVGEFPELQGIMGGYYAERAGEKPGVVSALQQQYLPAAEGCIPAAVALADRLDTLVAFFAREIRPTGSKDPFALRRAALQAIQTILLNTVRMPLGDALAMARDGLGEEGRALDLDALLGFFADRFKVQQREAGVRHDLIDAVFALGGEDDFIRLLARVQALQGFVETGEGTNLLAGYKRAANILRKEEGGWSVADAGTDDVAAEEQALQDAVERAEASARTALEAEDFTAAMSALASLRAPIDAFFDTVTVNDANPATRARRLGLLARFRDAVDSVADFSKIEG